jgi:hypothetical protein
METLFEVKTSGTDSKNCAFKSWLRDMITLKQQIWCTSTNIYTHMQSGVGGEDYLPFCHVLTYIRYSGLCLGTWEQSRLCAHGRDLDKKQGCANLARHIHIPHQIRTKKKKCFCLNIRYCPLYISTLYGQYVPFGCISLCEDLTFIIGYNTPALQLD